MNIKDNIYKPNIKLKSNNKEYCIVQIVQNKKEDIRKELVAKNKENTK